MSRKRRPNPAKTPPATLKGMILALVIGVPIFLGVTALLNLLIIGAIWPGEAKLFAPVICSDSHPDAYVVSDTYQVSDGTSTEFTVYCVADDGDAIDAGWGRAWFLGWVLHTVLIMGVLAVFVVRLNIRTLRRMRKELTDDDAAKARRNEGSGSSGSGGGGSTGRTADEAELRPADRTEGRPTTLQELIDRDFPEA